MQFLVHRAEQLSCWVRRTKNLSHLVQRLKGVKNAILDRLQALLDVCGASNRDVQELRREQLEMAVSIQMIQSVQHSLLQAAVHLVETQQHQQQFWSQQNARLLRQLEALGKQPDDLHEECERQARRIHRLSRQVRTFVRFRDGITCSGLEAREYEGVVADGN